MLLVHFSDTDDYEFTAEERDLIEDQGRQADATARIHLPLVDQLHLLVEPSSAVLDITGDNANTMDAHRIRWRVDPIRDVAQVCRTRLIKSFLHEAYHAARFRRLPQEASGRDWLEIAVGEGLATAFARDVGDAHEPWADYDKAVIGHWARDLVDRDMRTSDLTQWKFEHPDGRRWIAFRVGTWLVDQICADRDATPADLVWIPCDDLVASLPSRLRNGRYIDGGR